jgi:acetyl esterase/lipase
VTADPREVLTRPAAGPDFTVRYGAHPDQVADVRLPPGEVTRPLVIFIHGGFWKADFDRQHTAPLAVDLAGHGYPVATIEYRRMGQAGGGWPGTFDDVAAAVAAVPDLVVAAPAARGRIDRDLARPVVAGHSAGGHLALWVAGEVGTGVRGVLALAPVADLALAYRLGLDDGAVAVLLGGGPREVPERYAVADPARRPATGVPTVVVHGADDVVVPIEVGRGYVTAARRAGGDPRLVKLPGIEHFGVIDPRSPAWPAVLAALSALLDAGSDATD